MHYLSLQCISSMRLELRAVARGRPPTPLRSVFAILLLVILTPFTRRVTIANDEALRPTPHSPLGSTSLPLFAPHPPPPL
jgi:hypothetical protein